jgi:hypothetical protein
MRTFSVKLFGKTRPVTSDGDDDLLRHSLHSISTIGINLTAFKLRYPAPPPNFDGQNNSSCLLRLKPYRPSSASRSTSSAPMEPSLQSATTTIPIKSTSVAAPLAVRSLALARAYTPKPYQSSTVRQLDSARHVEGSFPLWHLASLSKAHTTATYSR